MTQISGTSNITGNSNLGYVPGSEHVICNNLSRVSISHMRAASAQWQQIKDDFEGYVYSAFWETRRAFREVRVIGMVHIRLTKQAIWCNLWYEGEDHPQIIKAVKIHGCKKCKT